MIILVNVKIHYTKLLQWFREENKEILNFVFLPNRKGIRRNPEMTQKALGRELSVSEATIKRTLMKMKRKGKVVREGSTEKENGYYLIKSEKSEI